MAKITVKDKRVTIGFTEAEAQRLVLWKTLNGKALSSLKANERDALLEFILFRLGFLDENANIIIPEK